MKLLAAIHIRVARKGDMEFAELGKSLNFLKVNRESLSIEFLYTCGKRKDTKEFLFIVS